MKVFRAMLAFVCAVLIALAAVCLISDLTGQWPGQVYAGEETPDRELLVIPAMQGIMDSANSLQRNYIESQKKDVESASEQVLVGTKSIDRKSDDMKKIRAGLARAGEVGSDAIAQIQANQMSYEDYYTLLEIVEAEATGGDRKSKTLIANVVLNRVKDDRFPDTVKDVVWQNTDGYAQFSPTSDGRISSVDITNSTIQAVKDALEGEDQSMGALFFVAPESADPKSLNWFEEDLVKLFSYGGHDFYTYPDKAA